MGGGRLRLPSIAAAAAAAAALASAAATFEVPDKLHLKASPFLLYAAHPSMPLPPLFSPSSPCDDDSYIPFSLCCASSPAPRSVPPPPSSGTFPLQHPSSVLPCSPSIAPQLSSHFNGPVAFSQGSSWLGSLASSPSLPSSPSSSIHLPNLSHLNTIAPTEALDFKLSCPPSAFPSCLDALPQSGSLFRQDTLLSSILLPGSRQTGALRQLYSSITPPSSPPPHLTSLFSLASSLQASVFRDSIAWAKDLHAWHYPIYREKKDPASPHSVSSGKRLEMVVVLLGWLGANQKHLKLYADWYTSRGIHAVTFVLPLTIVLSLKAGGKAEQHIDFLVDHLALWLNEDIEDGTERRLIFHTFSNTGWLTYGVVLENLLKRDSKLTDKIKGCVVDSAPSPDLNPEVWASGFSAALLKKNSIATQGAVKSNLESADCGVLAQPRAAEAALLVMLEKFFTVFLGIPSVHRRLSEVVSVLSEQQPPCPQLYIYSTADRVIPAESVESFIAQQKQTGRNVRACNLKWSPHVDHFRSFPDVYGSQLMNFLQECLPK